ncbi:MAG: aminopeptidase P family protein [Firmicutes bacterium]|nr:aminopeptidase P family protein [Bacillota bacterium]
MDIFAPRSMSAKRTGALQDILKKNQIGCAVYATGAAFVYLLDIPGFWFQRYSVTMGPDSDFGIPSLTRPETIVLIPAEGEPAVFSIPLRAKDLEKEGIEPIVCFADYFSNHMEPFIHGGRVALGHSCRKALENIVREADQYHGTGLEFTDGEKFVDGLRMIKDEKEIGLLSKVAAFTDSVMEAVVPMLKPGVTPFKVEEEIQRLAMEGGASDISFAGNCICVEKGHPTAYDPYIFPKDRPMRPGTGIAFDMGFVIGGYCSDYGRTFFLGEPSKEARESYAALQEAQLYCIERIVPGRTKVTEVSDLIYEGLERFGRGHQLRNHADGTQGHQIGLEVHETPWLKRNSPDIAFQPGMVFALEPKIFIPNEVYMRVEDMVLVTESGAKSLTVFDRKKFGL